MSFFFPQVVRLVVPPGQHQLDVLAKTISNFLPQKLPDDEVFLQLKEKDFLSQHITTF